MYLYSSHAILQDKQNITVDKFDFQHELTCILHYFVFLLGTKSTYTIIKTGNFQFTMK